MTTQAVTQAALEGFEPGLCGLEEVILSTAARQSSPSTHRSLTLEQRACAFRHHPTASEALLWQHLKGKQLGVQFRRQCIVGDFIVDLLASSIKLVVEIDGGYHTEQVSLDARRQRRLERAGYHVLRLPHDLVLRQTAVAVQRVRQAVQGLSGGARWLASRPPLGQRCAVEKSLLDAPSVPLPKEWSKSVSAALVYAVALARVVLLSVRGYAMNSPIHRVRLAIEVDELRTEAAWLRAELTLVRARLERVPARSRPHYSPSERLRILQLRAARGWSKAQIARRLLLSASTVGDWMRRLDDKGEDDLIRVPVPVNRFPDAVKALLSELRALMPSIGKVQMANILARAGLHISASTIGRLGKPRRRKPPKGGAAVNGFARDRSGGGGDATPKANERVVTAHHPNHLWHIDITVVPTVSGFWLPWLPFSLPTRWPFCWHLGVVMDHFSRRVLSTMLFGKEPTSEQMCALIERAQASAGGLPKYLVSDKGAQFFGRDADTEYQRWCAENNIACRFGAVGKKGSIALIERFIRSLKVEALSNVLIGVGANVIQRQLDSYARWYNGHRPHSALSGLCPDEAFFGRRAAKASPRFEPRKRYPLRRAPKRGAPKAVRGRRGVELDAVVRAFDGNEHLPVVELRRAA